MHIPKTVRRTIVFITIFILVLLVIGTVYVYLSDRTSKDAQITKPANIAGTSPVPQPVLPGSNSPEGVAIESLTSPVNAGSNASASVITNAGSMCAIEVNYDGVQSSDSGLTSKLANSYGNVVWSWTVGNSVPIGNWPVKITCTYNGRSAVVDGSIQITK